MFFASCLALFALDWSACQPKVEKLTGVDSKKIADLLDGRFWSQPRASFCLLACCLPHVLFRRRSEQRQTLPRGGQRAARPTSSARRGRRGRSSGSLRRRSLRRTHHWIEIGNSNVTHVTCELHLASPLVTSLDLREAWACMLDFARVLEVSHGLPTSGGRGRG